MSKRVNDAFREQQKIIAKGNITFDADIRNAFNDDDDLTYDDYIENNIAQNIDEGELFDRMFENTIRPPERMVKEIIEDDNEDNPKDYDKSVADILNDRSRRRINMMNKLSGGENNMIANLTGDIALNNFALITYYERIKEADIKLVKEQEPTLKLELDINSIKAVPFEKRAPVLPYLFLLNLQYRGCITSLIDIIVKKDEVGFSLLILRCILRRLTIDRYIMAFFVMMRRSDQAMAITPNEGESTPREILDVHIPINAYIEIVYDRIDLESTAISLTTIALKTKKKKNTIVDEI